MDQYQQKPLCVLELRCSFFSTSNWGGSYKIDLSNVCSKTSSNPEIQPLWQKWKMFCATDCNQLSECVRSVTLWGGGCAFPTAQGLLEGLLDGRVHIGEGALSWKACTLLLEANVGEVCHMYKVVH